MASNSLSSAKVVKLVATVRDNPKSEVAWAALEAESPVLAKSLARALVAQAEAMR